MLIITERYFNSKITYFVKYVWTQNLVFVLEFDEEDEDDDEFFRKWSKDHTTLLKGSDVISPKKHIFIEYVWTQYIFVFIFRSKKMIIKDEDDSDGAFPSKSLFEHMNALINSFYSWYQSKRYHIMGIVWWD